MTTGEIRKRAGAGIAAVGLRQLFIRLLGLAGSVILARLLLPRDFGAVAIGTSLVTLFGFAADAGIGAGLIRGQREPEREDLQAFLALQLLVSFLLAALTVAVAWPLGLAGRVTAVMVASLPLLALRTPGAILLERALNYQQLVVIELVEALAFYAWAVTTVVLGWGVWGLATAIWARNLVGSILMLRLSGVGILLPKPSYDRVRGLLRFGMQYQAVGLLAIFRDQGLNIGTALIAGVTILGLWTLAYRILQVPFLLFESLWRVSFPAMSRLLAAGEDPRPIIEKGLARTAVAGGLLLAALVGSTPALIPSIFGSRWSEASSVIAPAALGLMVAGPLSVATAGYLYAVGESESVLLAAGLHTLAWMLITFPLLRVIGVAALGWGWLAAALVEAVVLALRTRRRIRISFVAPLALPTGMALLAAGVGWELSVSLGPHLLSTVAGGGVAAFVYGLGMLLLSRRLVLETLQMALRSFRQLRPA